MSEVAAGNVQPPEFGYLQSDEPITRRAEDRLNRARLAEVIADQVTSSPPGQGFVIAIDGSWGSGKTSVLNMVEEVVGEKSETVVLRFNPWLFSGTEELVLRFLQELRVQLGGKNDERLADVAERLAGYGEALEPLGWVPVAGTWLVRAALVAKVLGRRPKQPLSGVVARDEVKAALSKLDRRVVVIVDDLDRIEHELVRDAVRLIKLVADFPNVTYLLAYDGSRLAPALGPSEKAGREYLEKIVQVTHDLPEIMDWSLVRILLEELDAAIQPINHGEFFQRDWDNVFHTGIRPFFKNLRDVRAT